MNAWTKNKSQPLITVYITNRNYGRYIEQSIQSVLNQTIQQFELLIIDDGSTDNSRDIIERYRDDERITIIYQKNKGLNISNNVAMRAAKGKYIIRLDADDFLEPDALEVMSDVFENDDELGLIFPDYYYVDKDGNRIGRHVRNDFQKAVSLYDQPAHGACTMIRSEFLKRLGGYNESFSCQDGYDIWIKFITHYKVTNVNKPLFSYRRHGKNLTCDEGHILDVRQKIKDSFVRQNFKPLTTLAIIPVRNTFIGGKNWPVYEIDGRSIVKRKVQICLDAKLIKSVVVTSSDRKLLEYCKFHFDNYPRVRVVHRPKDFESPNQSLADTVGHVLDYVQNQRDLVEAIMTVSLEYPFVKPEVLDEAVNTQVIFNADSVISVRPDNRMYYRHLGSGMVPILDQKKFTKLERKALYKGVGGIMLTTAERFKKSKQNISGKVAHVIVDNKSSFGVFDEFDMHIFESLVEYRPV